VKKETNKVKEKVIHVWFGEIMVYGILVKQVPDNIC